MTKVNAYQRIFSAVAVHLLRATYKSSALFPQFGSEPRVDLELFMVKSYLV